MRRSIVHRIVEQLRPLIQLLRQRLENQPPVQNLICGEVAGMGYVKMKVCDGVACVPLGRGCLPNHFERVLSVQEVTQLRHLRALVAFMMPTISIRVALVTCTKIHDDVSWVQIGRQATQ